MKGKIKILNRILALALCATAGLSMIACGGGAPSNTFDPSSEILLVVRESSSGTYSAFSDLFGIGGKIHESASIKNSTGALRSEVAAKPAAIGFVSAAAIDSSVKALEIDGVACTTANIANSTYKISRPFNLVVNKGLQTAGTLKPALKDFMTFVLSTEGQAIIESDELVKESSSTKYGTAKDSITGTGADVTIIIRGSTSIAPVMEKLTATYKTFQKNVTFQVSTTGSSQGKTAAKDDTVGNVLGLVSSEVSSEGDLAVLAPTRICKDGIAVVVNKLNTIKGMTKAQVAAAFTGVTLKWSDVA